MNNHKIVENYRNPEIRTTSDYEKVCDANNGQLINSTKILSTDSLDNIRVCVSKSGYVPSSLRHNYESGKRYVCSDQSCSKKYEGTLPENVHIFFPMNANHLPFQISGSSSSGITNISASGGANCGKAEFICVSVSGGGCGNKSCTNSENCIYNASKDWCVRK